jgi:hypothetical protein
MDSAGNLFVADVVRGDPSVSFIYKFSPDGVRSTFANLLGFPTDMAFDAAGNLFVGRRPTTATSIDTNRTELEPPLLPASLAKFTWPVTVRATYLCPGPLVTS